MLQRILFLLSTTVLLLGTTLSNNHALYIGVIQLEAQKDTTALISLKVFSDDLQTALQNAYGFKEIEATTEICSAQSSIIQSYFESNLQIVINGASSSLQLDDCQVINDVHLLYFKLNTPVKWEELRITAPFFMEVFPTQSNVLHVSYKGTKQYGRITKQTPIYKLSL